MKRLFIFTIIMSIIFGTYYLYQRQLGAIAFLSLSIYFFIQAYIQLSKKTKENTSEKKGNGNDRYS